MWTVEPFVRIYSLDRNYVLNNVSVSADYHNASLFTGIFLPSPDIPKAQAIDVCKSPCRSYNVHLNAILQAFYIIMTHLVITSFSTSYYIWAWNEIVINLPYSKCVTITCTFGLTVVNHFIGICLALRRCSLKRSYRGFRITFVCIII